MDDIQPDARPAQEPAEQRPDPGAVAASRRRLQEAVGEGFLVEELLGRGGFADVFAATDVALRRRVAIKTLRPDMVVTEELLARFEREARAVGALRHPNIVPIFSVGRRAGVAYFVMPLIEGESLRARLTREGRLPVREARRILRDAAAALEAAHRAGLVHRDVKPDNILLEGEERRVQLTDFGIARAMAEDDARLTGSRFFVGTPEYTSPEQASGGTVDARSDLYALGVVGYQVLAGRLPFDGDSAQVLFARHIAAAAPPLRDARRDCPEDLATVVHRCLEKEPERRPASAGAVAEALDHPDDVVRRATPPASARPAAAGSRRLVLGAAALASAVIALELLLVGRLILAPYVVLAALGVLGAVLGRARAAGSDLRPFPRNARAAAPSASAEAEPASPLAATVRACRGHRARIVKTFEGLARSEQARFPELLPTVDGLVARAVQATRQLSLVEARLEEGAGAARGGRREELRAAHDQLAGSVERIATLLAGVEEGLEAAALGSAAAREELGGAVEAARGLLRG